MTTTLTDPLGRAKTSPLYVCAAFLLFATAVELLAETLENLDQPTHAVIWGALALTAYALGLMFIVGRGQGTALGLGRWLLGPWMLVWYCVAFGLATMTWIEPQTGFQVQESMSSVLKALLLVAIGMTAWVIGYLVGPSDPLRNAAGRGVRALGRRFGTEVRGRNGPWILYGIGVSARLILTVVTGRFGYVGDPSAAVNGALGYQQILNLLSLLAPLAVAAAAMQVYWERLSQARITLVILFLAEVAFGAAAGGKQSFVITALAVVIPFSTARHRMPKIAVLAFVLAFLIVIIPFNKAYRGAVRGGSAALSPSESIAAAPQILEQTITGQGIVTVVPGSALYLLQRIREIDAPAIIVQRTPRQVPYISSVDLATGPIATLVPRAIWPNKPILATGYQFSREYYGSPSTLYSSAAITPVGDLYRHGGLLPVLVGMFLLGCVIRLFDDALDVRNNPHAILLVLLLFPTFVKGETDWVTLMASIPGTILIWLLAVRLTFRGRGAL
jgi:hypothetical protein